MHRLLIPVDNSDNAMRALEHVLRLAKENGPMELVIVHAHEPPIVYGEIAIYMHDERAKELQRQHSEDILNPMIEKIKSAGVPFSSEIVVGDVAKSIVACAKTHDCDGIVMGTRGMGAIGNLVMGSVATKVIHLTEIPVTLVK